MYYKKTLIVLTIILGLLLTATAKAEKRIDWDSMDGKVYMFAKSYYGDFGYRTFYPMPDIDYSDIDKMTEQFNSLDPSKDYLYSKVSTTRIKDIKGNITTCSRSKGMISRTRYAGWDKFEWFPKLDLVQTDVLYDCKTKYNIKKQQFYYVKKKNKYSELEDRVEELEDQVEDLEYKLSRN